MSDLAIIILAAGKGTRMKSELAKVLHPVFGQPMICHVVRSTNGLPSNNKIAVIGHQSEQVQEALSKFDCSFAIQKEQLGTAHAVLAAKDEVLESSIDVMILYGDAPLVRPEVFEEFYQTHKKLDATLTFMTTELENPTNYGRILTDDDGSPRRIVEEKDASPEQKKIKEVNAGFYCVNKEFLFSALEKIDTNNNQGEFYLTDILEVAVKEDKKVQKFLTTSAKDVLGVNSRIELAEAEQELRKRRNQEVMMSGVSMLAPESSYISAESTVGNDTVIGAGVELRGNCTIGSNCLIDTGVILTNCNVADGVTIAPYSCRQDTDINKDIKTCC